MAKYEEDPPALTVDEQIYKDVITADPTAKVDLVLGRVVRIDAPGLTKAQLDTILNGRLTGRGGRTK